MKRDNIYRKVWEDDYGPIPKDEQGRSFEIHHKDGVATNNRLDNLMCISIKEHYDIHIKRGDHLATRYIAMRMVVDSDTTNRLLSEAQQKRVREGTHNFLSQNGGSERASKQQLQRVEAGTHLFITKEFEENRLESYYNSLEDRRSSGTYHMNHNNPGTKFTSDEATKMNNRRLAEGRHPSQVKKECPHCSKVLDSANYSKYHGDRCKMRKQK